MHFAPPWGVNFSIPKVAWESFRICVEVAWDSFVGYVLKLLGSHVFGYVLKWSRFGLPDSDSRFGLPDSDSSIRTPQFGLSDSESLIRTL